MSEAPRFFSPYGDVWPFDDRRCRYDEVTARNAVVAEALSWVGTPYRDAQRVKGRDGGVDCLTFVVEVFGRCGVDHRYRDALPFYPQDWHLHRDEERYANGVLEYAREFEGPPGLGDIVLFRFGRCFAHGGIVTAWPMIVHAWRGQGVVPADANQALLGGRPRRFFSPFQPRVATLQGDAATFSATVK